MPEASHYRHTSTGPTGPFIDSRARARRRGRRRYDLPPAAVVLLALIAAGETVALAWLAAGH